MKGRITKTGYRRNSPDVNNDFNIIPSNRISMKGVDFPVFGVDNMGNSQMMYPGGEYEYQGDYVTELPAYGSGGLTQWFAEKWVDIKTGKKCGRSGKDKKGRPYPACRPSKRVNKTTPKTKGEMSASEKAKFKRSKTSGKRINYNHKRAQEGIEVPNDELYYQTLPSVDVTFDKNTGKNILNQYPYYNQLSSTERKYFNDSSAIGRGVRRRARVGDKSLYGELESGAKSVLNTAAEYSGLAGSVRFAEDPKANLIGAGKAVENFMLGSNPMAGSFLNTEITPEQSEQFFNTLDFTGMVGAATTPLKPITNIRRTVNNPAVREVGQGIIDGYRLKSLGKQQKQASSNLRAASDNVEELYRNKVLATRKAEDLQNARYDQYQDYFKNTPYSTYGDYLLTRGDKLGKNFNLNNSYTDNFKLLTAVSNDYLADPITKGLRPASKTRPIFAKLNLNDKIADLNTGKSKTFTIQTPVDEGTGFIWNNDLNQPLPKSYYSSEGLSIPQEARNIVSNNINFLENKIPGFKTFGSSRGFADVGLPTFPKDYDGFISQSNYNKFVKDSYPVIDQSGVAQIHRVKTKAGPLDIDFNVIEETGKGHATGRLAEQLYRRLDPDDYYRQSENILKGNQKEILIPYNSEELISKTDFTKASVADAFEISSDKIKHINRPDLYLSYGDPKIVSEAQKEYAKSIMGSKAYLPPQYSAKEFGNINKNRELLNNMNFSGDINAAAADPEKMQAILNDYYFSNTVVSRGVDSKRLPSKKQIRSALTDWDPSAGGGSGMGAGLNNTLFGDSRHGNIYGHKQFRLNLKNDTPEDLINSVNKLNFNKNLDANELKAAYDVLDKYNLPKEGVQTKSQFLQRVVSAGPEALTDYNKLTGQKYIVGDPYGESLYVGSFNVFNPSEDLITMGYKNRALSGNIPVGKSWMTRKRNAIATNGRSMTESDFNTIRSLNKQEFNDMYQRLNTPLDPDKNKPVGILKAIDRSSKQPGSYRDRLFNYGELKGDLTYQQKIDYNIKQNKLKALEAEAEKTNSLLNKRINRAEELQTYSYGIPSATVVTGGIYGVAKSPKYKESREQTMAKSNLREVIKESGISLDDVVILPKEIYDREARNKNTSMREKNYNLENPMYFNGYDDYVVLPKKQEGGEPDLTTKYIRKPLTDGLIKFGEGVEQVWNSTAPVRDNLTAGVINQAIYGDPLTVAPKLHALQKTKDWTFENIRPVNYPSILNYMVSAGNAAAGKLGLTEGNAPPARDAEGDLMIDEEMYAKVMGVPHKSKYISESKYKPSKAKDSDAKYYTVDWDSMIDKQKLIDYAIENKLMKGENMVVNSLAPFLKEGYMPEEEFKNIDPLQNFTIGLGEDDKGRYLSVYDKYDFNKTFNTVTAPFEIYDRFHLYKLGGENIPVYNTYNTKNRAWLAARKNLGPGKKFMYGGKVYSTNTPKGL
jgi:hypothetical protein